MPGTSAFAVPTTMEQVETGNFHISSVWLGATRQSGGASQSDTQTDSTAVSLAGFDSSLGELTGVTLFFNSWWKVDAQVNAIDTVGNWGDDTSQGSATSNLGLLIDLVTPNGGANSAALSESASCTKTRRKASSTRCQDTETVDDVFNGSLGLGSLSLDDFIGTDLTFQLTRTITITASSTDNDSQVVAGTDHNQWNGSVTAHYAYVERTEVPEPASLALIGAGLVAMRFRRRSKVSQLG